MFNFFKYQASKIATGASKEISEYNKLGYCMKEFAKWCGMACGCKECLKTLQEIIPEIYKRFDIKE